MASQSQSQNNASEDSRFTELIKPIKDLTQNFEVPLFDILEKYIDQLREIREDGTEHIAAINFAEAAFIIQSTATVYGKKVDFLHEKSLSVLATLAKGPQGGEGEAGDEEGNEAGGQKKRRGAARADLDFGPIKVEIGKSIHLKPCTLTLRELQDRLGFIQITPRQLVEKESIENGAAKIDLYFGPKFELLGAKKDFRLNSQYSSATGMLGEGLTSEVKVFEEDGHQNSMEWSVDFALQADSVAAREATLVDPPQVEETSPPIVLTVGEEVPGDPGGELQQQQQGAEDDEMEAELAQEAGFESVVEPPAGGEGDLSERMTRQARGGKDLVATRPQTPLVRPTTPEVDPWEPLNPYAILGTPRPIGRGQTIKHPPSVRKQHAEEKRKRPAVQPQRIGIADFIHWGTEEKIVARRPELHDLVMLESERRRDIARRMKRDRGRRNAPFEAVENYDEEQGSEAGDYGDQADIVDDFDNVDRAVGEEDGGLFNFPDPHLGGDLGPALDLDNVDPAQGDSTESYEDLVRQRVQEFLAKSAAFLASSELARKVSAWHEMIAPRLELVEQRSEFDIHAYGTQILNNFDNERGATRTFAQLMGGRAREEVARYFLSSLMLANCMNLEIVTEDGEDSSLAMDNMRLRFLSEKRHHEELEEFQAASQQRDSSILARNLMRWGHPRNLLENQRRRKPNRCQSFQKRLCQYKCD